MQMTLIVPSAARRVRALASIVGTFGLLSAAGCALDSAGGEDDSLESVAAEGQALHSGGGTIPWRGNTPLFPGVSSARAGVLSVISTVDIGMTRVCSGGVLGIGQECHHELRGLQVWSYAPSNPDNFFRTGDQFWNSIIGQSTAGSWTRVNCPAGTVMSGYDVWSRSTRIEKMQIKCRDLISGVQQTVGSPVGSTSLLFSQNLASCGDYVGSLNTNPKGDGIGGVCVLK
jgi:hypothetical protein